ncbi:MAG: permease, partial [Parachlamydiaceae bacterium]|nr:permease [Parachlamydiaceae bacterium]
MRGIIVNMPTESSQPSTNILPSRQIPKPTNNSAKQSNLLQNDQFYLETLPKLLGKDFIAQSTLRSASLGKPNNLHPFSNWRDTSSWIDMCNVTVAKSKFGIFEAFAPNMATKMEERINTKTGLPEYWIFLRNDVFWAPLKIEYFPDGMQLAPEFLRKHQVTAEDYKFFYDIMMNTYVQEPQAVALRTFYNDLEEFEIVDKFTFIARWKTRLVDGPDGKKIPRTRYISKELTGQLKPLASFVYKYFPDGKKIVDDDTAPDTYRTNSVWAQNFNEHWAKNIIVSCGPWIFDGMTDRQIKFKRNPDFFSRFAALSTAMEIEFKGSADNIWQAFKSNQLDTYILPPEQEIELDDFKKSEQYAQQQKKGEGIQRLEYVDRSYLYIGWNQAKSFFKNRKVRQALTMAIDRHRIIQQNLNGMGIEITGPFYRFSPSYDATIVPWPFDPQAARRLLEEEGWFDSDGDGILDKKIDGKQVPFKFSLTYFVKNPTSKSICEYIATALKEIGVICNLNGVDIADLSSSIDDKSFDALFMVWGLGSPPEDPRQLWYSTGAKEKGSSNAIGFANSEIDEIINALEYEYDREKRLVLYHRFHAIMNEEQPYTFLYTPKRTLLYRDYVKNVFIPAERQDLIPGANVAEPDSSIFWLNKKSL